MALGRDADAARAVELAGADPLAPERADEHAARGEHLNQSVARYGIKQDWSLK